MSESIRYLHFIKVDRFGRTDTERKHDKCSSDKELPEGVVRPVRGFYITEVGWKKGTNRKSCPRGRQAAKPYLT